jgi:phenylacetate-CoA ligase
MPSTIPLVDFERPARLADRQGRALTRHVADEVHPWSRLDRARLDRAGLGQRGVRRVEDLRRLPPVALGDLGDGAAATMRPAPERMRERGPAGLRARWWLADLTGRRARLVAEELDPRYKPVLWLRQGPLTVGCTLADLDRLADVGRRWLAAAGIRADDRLVVLGGLADDLGPWQTWLGCRAGGVASTVLPSAGDGSGVDAALAREVAALAPTAVAGTGADLLALAEVGEPVRGLRTVLVPGEVPGARDRALLVALAEDPSRVAVCGAWAPDGVRALWGECRGGHLHTWPDSEVVEVLDPLTHEPVPAGSDGELVWTPIGWRGTAALRLATGAFGRLEPGPCPACRRTTPRVALLELDPPFAAALDAHPDVVDWFAEVDGHDLLVEVALRRGAPPAAIETIAAELGATVRRVPPSRVRKRREAAGARILERADGSPVTPAVGARR